MEGFVTGDIVTFTIPGTRVTIEAAIVRVRGGVLVLEGEDGRRYARRAGDVGYVRHSVCGECVIAWEECLYSTPPPHLLPGPGGTITVSGGNTYQRAVRAAQAKIEQHCRDNHPVTPAA